MEHSQWIEQLEHELKHNILSFWLEHGLDQTYGGFLGEVHRDLTVIPEAAKSSVLNTRLLWTFATAYRTYKEQQYLDAANRAFEYLNTYFIDPIYGGVYWMLNADGTPLDTRKQIYAQAFAVYAYAEFYRATGNQEALSLAQNIYQLIERHGYDPVYGGYYEAKSEQWLETDNYSLSSKDLNEKKSMNTNLHVLEAYTNLYRVDPSTELHEQLKELIQVTIKFIVDNETGHYKLFFNDSWESQSTHISYGHDIEGSWLLVEAAEVLGDEEVIQQVKSVAIHMAEAVLARGLDDDGGLLNEADGEIIIDDHKDWWPQAEAMVGFFNAYQITKNKQYYTAALRSWQFIQQYIVDHQYGEWHWSVERNGTPSQNPQKISAWKCPYHNSRACFEMIERLK